MRSVSCMAGRRAWMNRFEKRARFYVTLVIAVIAGISMDFGNISPIKGMYWSALVNGLLAPFLLVGILMVASNKKIMRGLPSSLLSRIVVALATLAMFGAAIAMFVV